MIKIPLNYQINKKRTTQKKKKKTIKMMEFTSNNLQNVQDISQNFTNCPPKTFKSHTHTHTQKKKKTTTTTTTFNFHFGSFKCLLLSI